MITTLRSLGAAANCKRPVIAVRVPPGWLRQIERTGDKLKVARALIGSPLSRDGKRFVVSNSDSVKGHSGRLYKAANFQYLGRAGGGNGTPSMAGAARRIGSALIGRA